jgi:hypothetical protein
MESQLKININEPIHGLVVTICSAGFNTKLYIFPTLCMYMFCIFLYNNHYVPTQYSSIFFYDGSVLCSL